MKIKKMMKHLFMLLLITAMVLPWMAEVNTVKAVDPNTEIKNGTITITKYEGTTSTWDDFDEVQTAPTSGTKLDGVTFKTIKVADIVSGDDGRVMYKITSELATLLGNPFSANGTYSSTGLQSALQSVSDLQANAETVVASGRSATTGDGSNAEGVAKFENLTNGLYLVVETATPADVTSKSVPFFVSMPSIVNNANGNTTWTSDVNAYPKNNVGNAEINKEVEGTNKTWTTATTNDEIEYKLNFTVPVPADGLKQLYVIDNLPDRLTYKAGTLKVYTDSNYSSELATSNYWVYNPDGELKVWFKDTYLDTIKTTSLQLYIQYTCTLDEDATLGSAGNTNTATLYYSNAGLSDTEQPSDPEAETNPDTDGPTPSDTIPPASEDSGEVKVYTYGIDIKKQNAGSETLSNVVFKLYSDVQCSTEVFANKEYKTGTDGKAQITGLAAGTYYLKETKTNNGYVLLKDPIKIEISAEQKADGTVTASAQVNDGTKTSLVDGDGYLNAFVELTVVNDKGFSLPTTGAEGTAMFAFLGIFLVIVAGTLLIIKKRQR